MTDRSATTAQDVMRAAKRAAVSIAGDPIARHYSPDTLGLVLERVVFNLAGAGDLANVSARLADDPKLKDVPFPVVEAIVPVAFKHFATALAKGQ